MFAAAKDAMSSRAAQSFLNNFIGRYGKVETLKIDSRAKTLAILCTLDGETQPVSVDVGHYQIEQRAGKSFIRVSQIRSNRRWLQAVLNDNSHRELELPSWAAAAL